MCSVGVDLEKKRKLLLYPREYQRGSRCDLHLKNVSFEILHIPNVAQFLCSLDHSVDRSRRSSLRWGS